MASLLKTKVRIGRIAYTNCVPFFHGLESCDEKAFDLIKNCPAKINHAMNHGEIDIAPISSLEYLDHQDQYLLLPDIGISAKGFSGSVLLFSHDKIDKLNQESIAVTEESLSSATLLRILLRFKYKFENDFLAQPSAPEEMLRRFKAALVIGDDALFYRSKKFVYKTDLSEVWWNWTEKPFCFALWAVRREFAEKHPDVVRDFYANLKGNLDRNLLNIEVLVKDAMGINFLDEKYSKIFGYLFNLQYHLDSEVLEGLELFYRLAKRLGVSPAPQPIEFFKIK